MNGAAPAGPSDVFRQIGLRASSGPARETARAIRVRLTRERRRMTIVRLKVDRAELYEALTAMGGGLDLPGQVMPDGTIGASEAAPMA